MAYAKLSTEMAALGHSLNKERLEGHSSLFPIRETRDARGTPRFSVYLLCP